MNCESTASLNFLGWKSDTNVAQSAIVSSVPKIQLFFLRWNSEALLFGMFNHMGEALNSKTIPNKLPSTK
jgi:hypothetical protein